MKHSLKLPMEDLMYRVFNVFELTKVFIIINLIKLNLKSRILYYNPYPQYLRDSFNLVAKNKENQKFHKKN